MAAGAQNQVLIDSLHAQLKSAGGVRKFDLLNALGFEYRYSRPDSTFFFCQQAYVLGQSLRLPKDLAKPLSFIGLAKANQGDYTASFEFHRQSVEMAAGQQDSVQLGFAYNNLGRLFFDQGDLIRAYDNFSHAQKIFESLNEYSGLAYVYRSLANIYKSQRDFVKAQEMSRRALELRQKLKDKRTLASAYMEFGLVYDAAHRITEAKELLLKADSVAVTLADPVTRVEIGLALAEVLFKEGAVAEAARKADEVLALVTDKTNQKLFLRALLLKARFFIDQKRFGEAEANLLRIAASSEATGNLALQRDACFYLVEVANRTGRPAVAAAHQSRHDYLSEKLENSDLSRQILRLEFQLALEKMESENAILKANDAADRQTISNQRLENLILLGGVIFITLLAGLSWWGARRTRRISNKLALQNEHILMQRDEIQMQNEVLQANYRVLEALDEEKTTLMNIVAHDLKAPLNRILGLAHLLAIDGGVPQQREEYIRMLKHAAKGGLDLITDLLDVNEIEAARQPHVAHISVAALCHERLPHYELLAGQKNIRIRVQQQAEGKVLTDPDYIVRIVDNLVTNAIKFSPPGTEVTIGCELTEKELKITVADQGPGFSEEDRKFLFQKFRKLSARPTGGETSNGLGLAIVKILVDRLHGQIELDSEPGRGSRFSITLPVL